MRGETGSQRSADAEGDADLRRALPRGDPGQGRAADPRKLSVVPPTGKCRPPTGVEKSRRGRPDAGVFRRAGGVLRARAEREPGGGIDAEAVYREAEARLPEGVRLGAQAVARDARVAWYAWLGRRAVRIWIAAACLSLLDFRFGCGRRRFAIASVERDFAIPLAAFASEWLERFFGGTDHSMADEQAARMRILRERYNVDLRPVDPDRDNAAEVLRLGLAPEDKPPVKRDVPEEYARILDEVQRGRGTGIFPGGGK